MPALCGIGLLLSPHAARALHPWLDDGGAYPQGPSVEVDLRVEKSQAPPPTLALLLEDSGVRLAQTATGLLLSRESSWFAIEGSPAVIRGVIGTDPPNELQRELLLCALLIALRTIGVHSLHSAALCTHDHALVLVGDSGTGKSTTATALALGGCRYLGDDAILIRKHLDDVELIAYWPSFRLTNDVIASFPTLQRFASKGASDTKWKIDCSSAFPGRSLARWSGPTTLLFLARSSRRDSTVSSLTRAEATGLLIAQSSALGLDCHPNPREHLDLLAMMTNRAQVARLELGREWLDDPLGASQRLLDLVGSAGVREQSEIL